MKHTPSLNHAKGRGCEDDFYFTDAKMKAQSINALSMVTQMAQSRSGIWIQVFLSKSYISMPIWRTWNLGTSTLLRRKAKPIKGKENCSSEKLSMCSRLTASDWPIQDKNTSVCISIIAQHGFILCYHLAWLYY